ncbi:MAG TPA: lasso peptide biosynthesis B2 protein [Gemmatimonadaceae bacterium]|nr:lasso peptide biosynthesis B2 protein [Gemmatimonadaceae bacterium]
MPNGSPYTSSPAETGAHPTKVRAGGVFSLRAVRVGVVAAWRAPRAIESGLAPLLAPVESAAPSPVERDARRAAYVAHAALARLARLRPARWRATCLYRSTAECLALRALGLPARVVIGVGNDATSAATIAHAWVECDGVRCRSTRGDAELEALSARGA